MTLAADEEAPSSSASASVPSNSPAPAAGEEDDGFAQFMAFLQSPSTAGGSAEPHKGIVEGASKLVTMMVPPADDEEDENGVKKEQPPESPAKDQARTSQPAANYNDLIKKNSKKGKKGKKKKDDDEGPKKKVLSILEKEEQIDAVLRKRFDSTDPVEEVAYDPFTLDLEITSAIRLIQKNERGRQGRNRYLDALQKIESAMKTTEIRKRVHNGKM